MKTSKKQIIKPHKIIIQCGACGSKRIPQYISLERERPDICGACSGNGDYTCFCYDGDAWLEFRCSNPDCGYAGEIRPND